MDNFDEYICQGEPEQREKALAWSTAIGLQAVDGLKPSAYLYEVAQQHIEGDISIDQASRRVNDYYVEEDKRHEMSDTHEADKASVNIARILGEKAFAFTPPGLISIHKRIFQGVFDHAGKVRQVNITKREWALDGDTVTYVTACDIQPTITYDLQQERKFDYSGLSPAEVAEHVAHFVSGLWQIHPFREGNTRTTAVFTILYLRSLGFVVNNDLFAAHSWYFRNALVRSNYQHVERGIRRDFSFLVAFFRNLLLGEKNELRNRYTHVRYQQLKRVWESKETKYIAKQSDGINDGISDGINDGINDGIKLTERERQVLARVAKDAGVTAAEMAKKMKCSLSVVERALRGLKSKGYLAREGARKNGSWRVLTPGAQGKPVSY